MRDSLLHVQDVAPAKVVQAAYGTWPWRRLRNFTLGPFRGFRLTEKFDVAKQIVLFYGPNSIGKTRLCESLEFALLGEVEEAEENYVTDAGNITVTKRGQVARFRLLEDSYHGRIRAGLSYGKARHHHARLKTLHERCECNLNEPSPVSTKQACI
ncbi:AAA family ATPase [Paraburkholderia sp. Ac-20340]|uniref:AAA family ATPase n=1 Tax=Paraburkholderia sp. Ac-20340 TaxID=2703888 RepID=UPI00198181C2|nr:AAA family ATPase [Paraburkholderia sp. Ac-20340]